MPAVNCVIYDCSSLRTIPRVITIQELHTGGKTLLQLLHKMSDRRQFEKANKKWNFVYL